MEKILRPKFDEDVRVRATSVGFYSDNEMFKGQVVMAGKKMEIGEEFTLKAGHRLGSWMELVEAAKLDKKAK